ncbi:autotransporter outer membrane beta-barrel domain-containing protein [Crenobacter sp. SG2303]|uniref:Autotransporter outer membrane beta-barrel domain-containing protein n=1 Tax=Crenobacter oryzisoli TaxID=3056844 RepID=A0ABT7XMF2_9NEIS|nr:autotransporter outer membrane beta-barrel domain-containing protein [Crenobacter sp. SG2303]MDN0074951.1 autotransporter outer membrane beta-barrel domain-containing protein [Crenobacter sp. SG2303]
MGKGGRGVSAWPLALLAPLAVIPLQAGAAGKSVAQLEQDMAALQAENQSLEQRIQQLESRLAALAPSSQAAAQPMATATQPMTRSAPPAATVLASTTTPTTDVTQTTSASTIRTVDDVPKSVEDIYQTASGFFSSSKFSIEPSFSYSYYDVHEMTLNGFLALDSIFLGNINIDRIKSDTYTFDVTTRYSPTPRLQFDIDVPMIGRDSTYFSGGVGGSSTTLSQSQLSQAPKLGDVSAGISYKLVQEDADWPDIVGSIRVKAPTGKEPYGIKVRTDPNNDNLSVPDSMPTGNGLWAATAGMSFVKTIDPAVVFANLGYTYYFDRHFNDISSNANQQVPGSIKLGNSWQLGAGVAFALNDRISLGMSYSQQIEQGSQTKVDGGSWQGITGSDANAASINLGLTFAMSRHFSIIPTVSFGLTPDSPNYSLSVRFPYQF